MEWTKDAEKVLLHAIYLYEPWNYAKRTQDRSNCWERIAECVNAKRGVTLTGGQVRNHLNDLIAAEKKKDTKERGRSGEAVSEVDVAIIDINDRFAESDARKLDRTCKIEADKSMAEEARKLATESLKETRKRHLEMDAEAGTSSGTRTTATKTRKTGGAVWDFLAASQERRERMLDKEMELRREEAKERARRDADSRRLMEGTLEVLKKFADKM